MKLKYFIYLMAVLSFTSCKTVKTTTIKDHILTSDVLVHETTVITPQASTTWRYKTPCKNDSLVIADQQLTINGLKVQLRNVKGELVLEAAKPADTIFMKETTSAVVNTTNNSEDVLVTKTKLPKILWYSLIANVLSLVWIFRKFIPGLNMFL